MSRSNPTLTRSAPGHTRSAPVHTRPSRGEGTAPPPDPPPDPPPTSSIVAKTVAAWDMDESGGTRVNALGNTAYDLPGVGAIGKVDDGKLSFAARAGSGKYLRLNPIPAELKLVTANEWELQGWARFTNLASNTNVVVAIRASTNADSQFELKATTTGQMQIRAWRGDTAAAVTTSLSTGTFTASEGVWYHFRVWYDPAEQEFYLLVNNQHLLTITWTFGWSGATTSSLGFGWTYSAGQNVDLDEWTIHDELLTTEERDTQWNDGEGMRYPYDGSGGAEEQTPALDGQFYASVNGNRNNTGHPDYPWDLETLLSGGPTGTEVNASRAARTGNDPVYLKILGGTYYGRHSTSNLVGTETNKIIICPASSSDTVILDGFVAPEDQGISGTLVYGVGCDWVVIGCDSDNFFIQLSNSERIAADPDPFPPADQIGGRKYCQGIDVRGNNLEIVGLTIRDVGVGLSAYLQAQGMRAYGLLRWNVGWGATSRGHGHGTYQQNDPAAPRRYLEGCLSVGAFGYGDMQYGDSTQVSNFDWKRNIHTCASLWNENYYGDFTAGQSQILMKCNDAAVQLTAYKGNFALAHPGPSQASKGPVGIAGYTTQLNEDIAVIGNYFLGTAQGLGIFNWTVFDYRHNTVFGDAGPSSYTAAGDRTLEFRKKTGQVYTDWVMDRNRYFSAGRGATSHFRVYNDSTLVSQTAFTAYQTYMGGLKAGLEANSTGVSAAPTFTEGFALALNHALFPTPGRALLVVMNYGGASSFTWKLRHTVTTSGAALTGATTLAVNALTGSIPAQDTLTFGAVTVTLERPALPGDTTLYVEAISGGISSGASAVWSVGLADGQGYDVVDAFHPWESALNPENPLQFEYTPAGAFLTIKTGTFAFANPDLTIDLRLPSAGGADINHDTMTNPGGLYKKVDGTTDLTIPHPCPKLGVFLLRPV